MLSTEIVFSGNKDISLNFRLSRILQQGQTDSRDFESGSRPYGRDNISADLKYREVQRTCPIDVICHQIRLRSPPSSHFCSSGRCEAVQGRARTSITLNQVSPWVVWLYCRVTTFVIDFGSILRYKFGFWPIFWTPQILGIPFKYKLDSSPYYRIHHPQDFQPYLERTELSNSESWAPFIIMLPYLAMAFKRPSFCL